MVEFSLFLTPPQQQSFAEYNHPPVDGSLTTKIFKPFWYWLSKWVPLYVAPNVLNLAGLLCLLQAFYLCFMYIDNYPRSISAVALFLVFCYHNLDAVSGKHAMNIANASPLGQLFQYACSNIGVVFTSLTLCYVLGITALPTLWYVVQMAQLLCLRGHISAFKRGYVQISFIGEGEVIWMMVLIGIIRVTFGLEPFNLVVDYVITYIDAKPVSTVYYCLFAYSLVQAITTLPYGSRNGMLFCLLYRSTPAVLIYLNLFSERTLLDIVCDGLFMSIVTTDVIVAKMGGRDLHPWVVIMAMGSLLSNFFTLALVFFYYITVLSEISLYMNLPLVTVVQNVYVDGIYDMCHLGHKLAFKNAIKYGTRLFVGVINDDDAGIYKRKPIMTTQERIDAVSACKYVHAVIPNAPCYGIPEDFIRKHNIHVVACSDEYDSPEDKYYAVPRKMGILKILPRTKGMSTSELIRRVVAYGEGLKADKEAAAKEQARVEKDKKLNQ